jgi:hypothetical protein
VSGLTALVYCTAMGYAAAGTISSFYQLVTSERPDFFSSRETMAGWIVAVVLIMFAGPAIVAGKIWNGVRTRQMSASLALAGTIFSTMWSVVAGIFFTSFLLTV